MKEGLKYLLLSFILMLSGHMSLDAQPCLPDSILFTTQGQIDSFPINHPNCTEIGGWLRIEGENIMNLHGLSAITSIGKNLEIWYTENLTDLSGFDNLTTVGFDFSLGLNTSLTNISHLSNLDSIGGGIFIVENPLLIDLWGLESITTIDSCVNILYNDNLNSLSGLHNLIFAESVYIMRNNALNSMEGLDQLSTVGNLDILWNNSLQTLTGLNSLHTIDTNFYIIGNDGLTSLNGIESLTYVGGLLNINGNSILQDLSGIENVEANTLTRLGIVYNDNLSECNVQSICDYIANPNNPSTIDNNAIGCNSVQEVEESCTVGIPEQQSAPQLSSFPNPFTTSTTIDYELTEPSHVQLTIYNAIGEVVYRTEDRMMLKGIHTVTWSPGHLPEGLYYAVLRSEEGVAVVKIIKQ